MYHLLDRLKEVPTPSECQQLQQPVIPVSGIFPLRRIATDSSEKEQERKEQGDFA